MIFVKSVGISARCHKQGDSHQYMPGGAPSCTQGSNNVYGSHLSALSSNKTNYTQLEPPEAPEDNKIFTTLEHLNTTRDSTVALHHETYSWNKDNKWAPRSFLTSLTKRLNVHIAYIQRSNDGCGGSGRASEENVTPSLSLFFPTFMCSYMKSGDLFEPWQKPEAEQY